uniref:Uncharacterized protein n=1 Tax=Brassica oleracea var. oleracea TaxID=109376 RepID=A0A0D3BG37_BRAOL
MASRSPAMVAAVSSRHFLGFSTYSRCFEFKSLSQMRYPAFLSRRRRVTTVVASAGNLTAPSSWESWKPDKTAKKNYNWRLGYKS